MAEIEEEVVFHTKADQVELRLKTNGDMIIMSGINLTQAQATSLAWLVNADTEAELEFSVKVKP